MFLNEYKERKKQVDNLIAQADSLHATNLVIRVFQSFENFGKL